MAVKKFNLAIQEDVLDWLTFEAARRKTSVTGCINEAIAEQKENASDEVKQLYKQFVESRNEDSLPSIRYESTAHQITNREVTLRRSED